VKPAPTHAQQVTSLCAAACGRPCFGAQGSFSPTRPRTAGAEERLAQSRADAAGELTRLRDELRAARTDAATAEGRREATAWRADELAAEVQSVRY
jgi:hypothetical protein